MRPAEIYHSQAILKRVRRQARHIWSVSVCAVFVWTALIAAAPLAADAFPNAAAAVYRFFGYICHQIDARSFHLHDHPLAVCARCFGIYFGLLAGVVVYPLLRGVENIEPLPRFWLFAAMIPVGVDWSLGVFGVWENTHWSRFVTGAILGFACGVFIIPALIEIGRNLFSPANRAKTDAADGAPE